MKALEAELEQVHETVRELEEEQAVRSLEAETGTGLELELVLGSGS